jgi:hypothetical protein
MPRSPGCSRLHGGRLPDDAGAPSRRQAGARRLGGRRDREPVRPPHGERFLVEKYPKDSEFRRVRISRELGDRLAVDSVAVRIGVAPFVTGPVRPGKPGSRVNGRWVAACLGLTSMRSRERARASGRNPKIKPSWPSAVASSYRGPSERDRF